MTDRKKPGLGFWTGVVIAGLVLYVLSIGPVIGLATRELLPEWMREPIGMLYVPLDFLARLGGDPSEPDLYEGPFGRVLLWYITLWAGPN